MTRHDVPRPRPSVRPGAAPARVRAASAAAARAAGGRGGEGRAARGDRTAGALAARPRLLAAGAGAGHPFFYPPKLTGHLTTTRGLNDITPVQAAMATSHQEARQLYPRSLRRQGASCVGNQ